LRLPLGAQLVRATNGLTITKSASSAAVDQGGVLTYTLVITNHTGVGLTDITVIDSVPADTQCENILAPSNWVTNGADNCRNDRLAVWLLVSPTGVPGVGGFFADGSSVTLVYSVRVDQPLPNHSLIINAASSYVLTATVPTTYTDSGTLDVSTQVNAPEWQIGKSATPTPTVQAGDLLTYTLSVTNGGDLSTSGTFYVVDTLPANTTFYAATGSFLRIGDVITWTISTPLAPGQATTADLVVQVDSPLTNGLTIANDDYRVFGANVYTGALGPPVLSNVQSQAQLIASKSTPTAMVEAGGLITYTLTVTNQASANGPADGVVITDSLPSNVVYEDMGFVPSAAGITEHPPSGDTGLVKWTLSDSIQPGDSVQVYVVGRVISPLPNGTSITNTCSVTATNALAAATCPSLVNTVTSAPFLTLNKSVTPSANVPPGGTVTYTLVISNTGNETATGVTVTDTLGSAFDPNRVTWNSISVPGRPTYGTVASQALVFTATVPLLPGVYYNPAITATYASTEVTATNLAPITVGSPDLRIHKSTTPGSVIAGGLLTYTIAYSNVSGVPATGVRITDTLGTNLAFFDASPMPDVLPPPVLAWDIGTLSQADGEQVITLIARVDPDTPNGTTVTNSAVITSVQNVGDSAGPVNATVLAPVLHIVKSDAGYDPIDAGALLTYTLTYSNTGDAPAHSVRITDTLDANVSYIGSSIPPTVPGPPDYVWAVGDLPAHSGPRTLTVRVRVAEPLLDGTELVNDVLIQGSEPFSDADSIITTVRSAPVFQVSKSASPSPATPGQPLTYTIVFTNVGNATATGVRITDTLDSNVSLQSSIPSSSGSVGNQVYWDWPSAVTIDDLQTIILTVLVTSPLADGTLLGNTVEVGSSQGATGTATIATPVSSAPELHVIKTATPPVVQPGGLITYTISYSNTGTGVTDAIITDTLDPNVNFVSATAPPDGLSPYYWNVSNLSPLSGTQVLTVVVNADTVLPDGTWLYNNVEIAGGGSSDSDMVSTPVQAVDLSISKSALPASTVQAGEWITYTITFRNAGSMGATGVRITDTLPVSLTNVISSSSPGINFIGGSPPYVWYDASVPGNSSQGVITITGQLLQSPWPSAGAGLTNLVTIRGDQSEAIIANNTSNVTVLGVPDDPYTVTLTPALTQTTVGTNVPVAVYVTDRFGNPARDGTPVNFSYTPTGSGISVTPPAATTSGGTASTTLRSQLSTTVTITATAGTASDSAQVTFVPGPLDHFAIGVNDPQTAGITFTIAITALDQYGNVADLDATVTLTDTTGSLTPTGLPTLVDGHGIISVTVYTATPADRITATYSTASGVSSPFQVLPGAAESLTVTVNPTTIRVCQTAAVTTTVVDRWGNRLPDQAVSLRAFPAPPSGGAATLSPQDGSTGPAGIFNSTLQGTGAGHVIIYAWSGSLNNLGSEPAITVNSPAIPTNLTLNVAPNPLYTGGATAVVTATVTDCVGPSSGQLVTFTLNDPSLAWFPGPPATYSATTNASGVATATLTSNSTPLAGTLTITGSAAGLIDMRTLDVELPPTPSMTIVKTASPPGVNVRPGQTVDYRIVARNAGGAPATGVVISDTLPVGVGLVSASAAGGTINGFTPLNVVTSTLPAGEAITVTVRVTVTAQISGTMLNNQASVASDQTLTLLSQVVSHRVITNTAGPVFLPILLNNWSPPPPDVDLVVQSLRFVPTAPTLGSLYHLEVVIRNDGNEALSQDFFVELYLNPSQNPPSVGQAWWDLSQSGDNYPYMSCREDTTCYGRAWRVTTDLGPGATLTLSTDPALNPHNADYDRWPTAGAAYTVRHTPIIVLVDSFGAVVETDETNNLSNELNVTGQAPGAGAAGITSAPPRVPPPALAGPHPILPPSVGGRRE
jgi:uncharacterized repeat protein (TIGR01451 family)